MSTQLSLRPDPRPLRSDGPVPAPTLAAFATPGLDDPAADALLGSGERFRRVVESLGDGLLVTDLDEVILYANARLREITGYGPEELVGRVATDVLVPEEERERVRRETRSRMEGVGSRYEVRHVRKDGAVRWVEISGVPFRDGGGRVAGTLGLIKDVTERKDAEAALRTSEERLRLVLRATNDVVWDWDIVRDEGYWSDSLARVFGYGEADVDTAHDWWVDALHPEDRERTLAEIRDALESGAEVWSGEYRFRRGDGSYASVLDRGYIARDEAGTPVRMSGSMMDLTERKAALEALRASEESYRVLFNGLAELVYVQDLEGRFLSVNDAVVEAYGYSREELLGCDPAMLVDETRTDLAAATDHFRRAVGGEPRRFEFWGRRRDGSCFPKEVVLARGTYFGREVVIAVARDITERVRAEAENARLAALSRENPNPVLECAADGRPLNANPAAQAIAAELGVPVEGLLSESHRRLVSSVLEGGRGLREVESEVGGRVFSWSYRPGAGRDIVYLFAVDITGRRAVEEQLRHDALHDALTGLPNRLLFLERLAHALVRSKRRDDFQFAVLFLDLDRFKVVNDSLGHHVGDELLRAVAGRLLACLRPSDTVARFGGDEFAILLQEIERPEDATRVAARIAAELAAPVMLGGFEVFTSVSVGIALSGSADQRPEYLIRNADMAMYRAKARGHAGVEIFDRAMHATALLRLQIETDLRHALERGEFRLAYQPVVEFGQDRIVGVEALLRWEHPDRGWMAPDEFIPTAEETGLIVPIGQWVLRAACQQMREWRERLGERAPRSMGVNLSTKQLSQLDVVERVEAVLCETGLPPTCLRLEVTESAIMENPDTAVVLLRRLRALGVGLSLDDFGTGYSSLSYLHRFPLDTLKIDRSFVGRMDEEPRSANLVQTILTLAAGLGVAAVAEGVENQRHLAMLREMGCTLGQGYLFARPIPPAELEALLVR